MVQASPEQPVPAVPGTVGAPAGDGERTPPGPADVPPRGIAADLPAKAVDTIDLVVDTINDKLVRPLVLAARAVVFGLLAAVLALLLLVMGAIAVVRLLDVYVFDGRVWASDALLGTVLVLIGLLAWSRRTARSPGAEGGR